MKKYFLILAFLCIAQPISAMENESRTTWSFRSIYAKVTNFFAKYIYKQNIHQEPQPENSKRTFLSFFTKLFSNFNFTARQENNQQVENNSIPKSKNTVINNTKTLYISTLLEPFVNMVEKAKEHNFDQDDLKKIKEYHKTASEMEYLEYFFQEHPEHAIKYTQYELSSNLSDAVETAEKNNFKEENDWENIKKCLLEGANVDSLVGKNKEPILALLIQHNKKDLFDLLIKNKANVNAHDKDEETPLFSAASWNENAIKPLIDYGADANARNKDGKTPLFSAASRNENAIKPLIDYGADVNALDKDGTTPLFSAILFNENTIKPLIDNGARVNACDKSGGTPLFWAVSRKKEIAIRILIDNGANINQTNTAGISLLEYAISSQFRNKTNEVPDFITVLYKNVTSLTRLDERNNSIFHYLLRIEDRELRARHVEAIITHTQDAYKQKDSRTAERFVGTYIVLGKIEIGEAKDSLPSDIRYHILSMLPENHFVGSDAQENFTTLKLLSSSHAPRTFYRVMQQMIRIQKALRHKNNIKKAPIQLLRNQYKEGKDRATFTYHYFNRKRPKKNFIEYLLKSSPVKTPNLDHNFAAIAHRYLLENK